MEVTRGVACSAAEKPIQPLGSRFPIASHRCDPLYDARDGVGTSILSERGYGIEQAALCLTNTPFPGNHAISMSYLLHLKAKR